MQAVADRAGVSTMTVSNVLNGVRKVGEETRQAVLAAVAELEYRPNMAARALASAGAISVGLVYQNAQNAFLSAMLVGTLSAASRLGVQVLIRQCDRPQLDEATAAIEGLVRSGANAILLPPSYAGLVSGSTLVRDIGVPLAAIAQGQPLGDVLTIGVDESEAAIAMMRHLQERGHRRIGFVTGPLDQASSLGRLEGFRRAMAGLGVADIDALVQVGDFSFESGLRAAEALLGLPQPPSAIFASNDDMAAAVSSVAHRHGLSVPGDLAIAGFDDAPIAVKIWPTLTTVRQRVDLMAEWATEALVFRCRGNPGEDDRRMPFDLVVREST